MAERPMPKPRTPDPALPNEAGRLPLDVRLRRPWRQLMDISMLLIGGGTSIGWLIQGHSREATILAFVTYWGAPWALHIDGSGCGPVGRQSPADPHPTGST